MIFEQLGILCTAPIDGHDIGALKETLAIGAGDGRTRAHARGDEEGSRLRAGRAQPREEFHGIAPYDVATGAR